jgi:LCP family protein required for cell wall assembly
VTDLGGQEPPDLPVNAPAGPGPTRRGWRRVLWRTVKVLALLVLLGVVAGVAFFAYANYRINQKGRHCAACSPVAQPTGAGAAPINILVLASDSRAGLSPAEAKLLDPTRANANSGERADSIALVHLEPATGKAVVISFPRDLMVPAPGGGHEKINAYFNSGPSSMVAEVESLTGLPINHYVEVDFSSFGEITQYVGGVDVYFNRAIRDPNSGLNQPKGCDLLNGAQALAFVRDRDTDSDFGRIARQRLYVTLMMNKILTPGTLFNPVKVSNLINFGLGALGHDSDLHLTTMLSLVKDFRHFNSGQIDFRVLPSYANGTLIDGVSYVIESTPEANALLAAVRDGTPLPDYGIQGVSPIQPSQIPLVVLNGTGINGGAGKATTSLISHGYTVLSSGVTTGPAYPGTVVYYTAGNQTLAQYLQAQEYPAAQLEALPATIHAPSNAVAVVVVGQNALAPSPSASPTPSPSLSPTPLPAGPAKSLATSSFGAPC